MPNNGKCMICGYLAPITAFLEAAGNGELVPEFIKLPQELQAPFCRYLSLFKPPSGRQIQPSKSLRLTKEMVALVCTGYVSRRGKVDRPCPPSVWVKGIEIMLEDVERFRSDPLENHNYLRKVVYSLADQADAGRERTQHQQVLNGNAQAHRDVQPMVQAPVDDGLSQLERQYLAKYGSLPDQEGTAGGTAVNTLANAWKKRDAAQENGE